MNQEMKIINCTAEYRDLALPGSFIGAVLTASGIKNTMIIFHGISGCNIEAVHFRSDQIPGGCYVPVIPTGLNEADCIKGGVNKLLSTLRTSINGAIKRNKLPDAVFVFTGDAPSVAGDDIYNAARLVEEETGVNIITADTPGFEGGLSHGFDKAINAIIEKIKPQIMNKGSISQAEKKGLNIIAPFLMGSKNWNNDLEEMTRLLQSSQIPVNLLISRNTDFKSFYNLGNARFNLNPCSETMSYFQKKSEELGIETLKDNIPLPIGVANTEEWLLKIASKFGKEEEAMQTLKKDSELVKNQLRFNYNFSWMSTLMSGKRCGILGSAKFASSLARCLLWDFRIIPKVIGIIAETPQAVNKALELLEKIKGQAEFIVLVNPSYFEWANCLETAEVDFAIGSAQDKPLCIGRKIPHLSLCGFNFFNQYNFIPYPNMGIRGVLGLLSELSRVMEDAFYLKDSIAANDFSNK